MSKGNYYSGSPIGPRIVDEGRIDEFMAKYIPWIIVGGVIGLGVLFYKATQKEENQSTKIEQVANKIIQPKDIISYNKIKTY